MADAGEFARKEVVESEEGSTIAAVSIGIIGVLAVCIVALDSVTLAFQAKQWISNIKDGIGKIRDLAAAR